MPDRVRHENPRLCILDYIGVSPKWVICRYRFLEAAERAVAADNLSWAGLAADLGYSDQAHLVRDFKRMLGVTPGQYVAGLVSRS